MLAVWLTPFLLALLISLLLDVPISRLSRVYGSRKLAAGLVFGLFLCLVLLAAGFGVSYLFAESERLLLYLAAYDLSEEWLPQSIEQGVEKYGLQLLQAATRFLRATPDAVVGFFVTLMATYYLCVEPELPLRAVCVFAPRHWHGRLRMVYQQALEAFSAYLRAQAVVVLVSTLLAMLGLKLLGVDCVLLTGLVIGLLDLLPMLGPGTLLLPWAAMSACRDEADLAVGLLVLYAVIILGRQLVEPRIMGAGLGLHPLAALAAGFAGLGLFGAFGLLLGPMLAGLAYFIYCESRGCDAA